MVDELYDGCILEISNFWANKVEEPLEKIPFPIFKVNFQKSFHGLSVYYQLASDDEIINHWA